MLPEDYKEAIELSENGDYQEAYKKWDEHRKSLDFSGSPLVRYYVFYYLADALSEIGRVKEAILRYEEASKLLPNNQQNLDFILESKIEICRLSFAESEYSKAEKIRLEIWADLLKYGFLKAAYFLAIEVEALNGQIQVNNCLPTEVFEVGWDQEDLTFIISVYRDYASFLLSKRRLSELLAQSIRLRPFLQLPQEKAVIVHTWLNEMEVYYEKDDFKSLKNAIYKFKESIRFEYPAKESRSVQMLFFESVILLSENNLEDILKPFQRLIKEAEYDEELHLSALQKSYQVLSRHYHYQEAIILGKEALRLFSNKDMYTKLDLTVDLATLYESSNDFKSAFELLKPVEIDIEEENDEELAQRYFSLLTKTCEQLPNAVAFENAKYKWVLRSNNLTGYNRFNFCFDYGRILIGLNQLEDASVLFQEALEIAIAHNWNHYIPTIVIEQAICEVRLIESASALEKLRSISPPTSSLDLLVTYLVTVGDCQTDLGQHKEARNSYREVIDHIEDHPYLFHYASMAYSNLGVLEHTLENYNEAEKLYRKGLEIDIKGGISQQQITAHYNLGLLFLDQGEYQSGEKHIWQAIKLLSSTYGKSKGVEDQKSISDEWFSLVELLVEILVEKGEEDNALRLLVNRNLVLIGLSPARIPQLHLPKLSSNQQLIAYSGIRRSKLFIFRLIRNRGEKFEVSCCKITAPRGDSAMLPDSLKDSINNFKKVTLRRNGERNKDYRGYFPWVIRYLNLLCSRSDRLLTNTVIEKQKALFHFLSEFLIKPLGNLEGHSHIITVPEYLLGTLPFGAYFYQGKRLIETFDISTFGGFAKNEEKQIDDERALAFGSTRFNELNLTDLPNGITELEGILSAFPNMKDIVNSSHTNIVEDLTFLVKKEAPKYLHFIGHTENTYPESVIYHSGVMGGTIPVSDIRKLPLKGMTVFISSCSSADGKAYAGWGIDSVAKSFIDAGASAVISLLFPVIDELSAKFVRDIYRKLSNGFTPEHAISAIKRKCTNGEYGKEYQSILNWGSLMCIKLQESNLE